MQRYVDAEQLSLNHSRVISAENEWLRKHLPERDVPETWMRLLWPRVIMHIQKLEFSNQVYHWKKSRKCQSYFGRGGKTKQRVSSEVFVDYFNSHVDIVQKDASESHSRVSMSIFELRNPVTNWYKLHHTLTQMLSSLAITKPQSHFVLLLTCVRRWKSW